MSVFNSSSTRKECCVLGSWASFLSFAVSSLCRRDCKDFRARILALASFLLGDLEQVLNLGILRLSKSDDSNTLLTGAA